MGDARCWSKLSPDCVVASCAFLSPSPGSICGFAWPRSVARSMVAVQGEGKTTTSCSLVGEVLPALSENVQHAVDALKNGQVIAVPTDTLYGLAADACSEEAIQRIYSIKGRISKNPLAICVGHTDHFERFSMTNHLPRGLLDALFPGPVTAVLPRGEKTLLHECLNPGISSIGIRIPDCMFIRQVAETFGGAIALTSANISGQSSTISIHEFEEIWEHCIYIFDAGELPPARSGSTIIDLTICGFYKVLREGSALPSTRAILTRYGLKEVAS